MIDTNKRFPPKQAERPGGQRNALKRWTHSWPLGVAYTIYISYFDISLPHSLLDQPHNPCAVVDCGIFGEESGSGRGNVGMAEVSEDNRGFVRTWVGYQADTDFVGAAFETESNHHEVMWGGRFGGGIWRGDDGW